MGKEVKTEVGTEVGKGVSKNPEQKCPYLFGILFKAGLGIFHVMSPK